MDGARRRKGKKRNRGGAGEGLGREEEEMEKKKKKKEDSPGDLRYETLIKIISSASVGCRGAYTTASRECNDLNGNNSVKDGCSRARSQCASSSSSPPPPPPLPFACFSFCTNGNKKPEVVRRGESCTRVTSSFGRGGFHLERRAITENDDDKNGDDTRDERIHEESRGSGD